MIRFDQRTLDVQGTERVFKKVVHSGQNAIRLVDKDGIPMRPPNTLALARLHSNYTISPRGVPTRKSSHSYSGQLAQDKMQNLVNSLETSSQEMASYNSLHSYPQGHGLSSAGSSRHYLSTSGSHKKKSYAPTRSVKSMNKSASSQRTRHLVSAPAADQLTDSSMDNHNGSPQGKRLGKEWSALSQCRALKRSSEIVSHRVDRMYFMTGSKLPIQSKYHVEDNELQQLRDLQQARTSSRNTRDELREQAQRLMKRRESAENNSTLVNIEKKLSNIEHRLSFIEEQNNEIQLKIRTNNRTEHLSEKEKETISGASSESGIDKAEMDDDQYLVSDHEVEEIFSKQSDIQKRLGRLHNMEGRSISKIKIRKKSGKTRVSADVHVWDILSHDKTATGAETMIKLLEVYPNVHKRARQGWEKNEFDTANELTLGIPRKIRRKKMKSPQKHVKKPFSEREIVSSSIKPTCRFCNCQAGKNAQGKDDSLNFDLRRDQTIHSFPTRKPSNRLLAHPRVECECRQDRWANKGLSPFLTVTGTHVPLRDREIHYT